jgi:protein-S-isoprenylcysteine O-methyltransferase Ste14
MKHSIKSFARVVLLVLVFLSWWWALNQPLSKVVNLILIAGSCLLIFPVIWTGRLILDKKPTMNRTVWITTFIHYAVGILFGISIIRAIISHRDWVGWILPVPVEIGLALVIITGAAVLLTVINLAIKGLGAPFAIALSRRLAVDWMYAWTRNPMVLAALALLVSLGIWFQSVLFMFWVLILFTPALLFFVKVYEERELEIRFGASYMEYKSRTPMLFPRKPGE